MPMLPTLVRLYMFMCTGVRSRVYGVLVIGSGYRRRSVLLCLVLAVALLVGRVSLTGCFEPLLTLLVLVVRHASYRTDTSQCCLCEGRVSTLRWVRVYGQPRQGILWSEGGYSLLSVAVSRLLGFAHSLLRHVLVGWVLAGGTLSPV